VKPYVGVNSTPRALEPHLVDFKCIFPKDYFILFYFFFVLSMFYRSLEEKEVLLEISGLKSKLRKNLKFLPERSIIVDLRLSALALTLAHARRGSIAVAIECTQTAIERTYA
jgi:hypothetical protein